MKFQDDISNMNTHIHTYIHTDKPKPICPPLFQSWGHNHHNDCILGRLDQPGHLEFLLCTKRNQTLSFFTECSAGSDYA